MTKTGIGKGKNERKKAHNAGLIPNSQGTEERIRPSEMAKEKE